jgi:hypothetical protein
MIAVLLILVVMAVVGFIYVAIVRASSRGWSQGAKIARNFSQVSRDREQGRQERERQRVAFEQWNAWSPFTGDGNAAFQQWQRQRKAEAERAEYVRKWTCQQRGYVPPERKYGEPQSHAEWEAGVYRSQGTSYICPDHGSRVRPRQELEHSFEYDS